MEFKLVHVSSRNFDPIELACVDLYFLLSYLFTINLPKAHTMLGVAVQKTVRFFLEPKRMFFV